MTDVASLTVPTLAETLERELDPTAFVDVEFLGEFVLDSMVSRLPFSPGSSTDGLLRRIAASPPADGREWRVLLRDLWRAELIEDPSLVPQVIDAVADPDDRLVLLDHRRRGIQQRHAAEAMDARRRSTWREPPEGAEWHDIDEYCLQLYATETGAALGEAAEDVWAALREVVEGLFPTIEGQLRPLVPLGVDVQLKVST